MAVKRVLAFLTFLTGACKAVVVSKRSQLSTDVPVPLRPTFKEIRTADSP